MAPAQLEAPDRVDARADVFSFGVLAYELAAGRLPLGRFSPPSRYAPAVGWAFDEVVMRCLEREPEDRYPDTGAVAQALALASPGAPRGLPRLPPLAYARRSLCVTGEGKQAFLLPELEPNRPFALTPEALELIRAEGRGGGHLYVDPDGEVLALDPARVARGR
ncbi:MAG: hypothetical protein AB7N76_00775 [Planctomycetota bacterium]